MWESGRAGVHGRRQRTECVNLPDFVKAETARDPKFLNYLAALAAMECPVVIPSKSRGREL